MKKYTYEVQVEVPTIRTVIVEAHDEDEAHTLGVKEACALVGGRKEDAHVERITVIEKGDV
tara:strand:+ start:293 stop:475 length:183 start_codon:yes stop_codon:yes gene_type:complete